MLSQYFSFWHILWIFVGKNPWNQNQLTNAWPGPEPTTPRVDESRVCQLGWWKWQWRGQSSEGGSGPGLLVSSWKRGGRVRQEGASCGQEPHARRYCQVKLTVMLVFLVLTYAVSQNSKAYFVTDGNTRITNAISSIQDKWCILTWRIQNSLIWRIQNIYRLQNIKDTKINWNILRDMQISWNILHPLPIDDPS